LHLSCGKMPKNKLSVAEQSFPTGYLVSGRARRNALLADLCLWNFFREVYVCIYKRGSPSLCLKHIFCWPGRYYYCPACLFTNGMFLCICFSSFRRTFCLGPQARLGAQYTHHVLILRVFTNCGWWSSLPAMTCSDDQGPPRNHNVSPMGRRHM